MGTSWQPDTATNRSARKYARREQVRRVAWAIGIWLFRLSPRPFFGWRRVLLRVFGARVGRSANVYPSARIYMPWNLTLGEWSAIGEDALIYNLGHVTIGAQATVSYRAHICAGTHDLRDPELPLIKPPVVVGDNVWIGTDAFIGPGVTIGAGAVIGARAVVVRDVTSMTIVAGNPARIIGVRSGKPVSPP